MIEVGLPIEEVRALLQGALAERELVEFQDLKGETLVINPLQVKVIQHA